jgi:hypothetical protein
MVSVIMGKTLLSFFPIVLRKPRECGNYFEIVYGENGATGEREQPDSGSMGFEIWERLKNTSRSRYLRDAGKDRLECGEWRRTLACPTAFQFYRWSSTPIQRCPGITGR